MNDKYTVRDLLTRAPHADELATERYLEKANSAYAWTVRRDHGQSTIVVRCERHGCFVINMYTDTALRDIAYGKKDKTKAFAEVLLDGKHRLDTDAEQHWRVMDFMSARIDQYKRHTLDLAYGGKPHEEAVLGVNAPYREAAKSISWIGPQWLGNKPIKLKPNEANRALQEETEELKERIAAVEVLNDNLRAQLRGLRAEGCKTGLADVPEYSPRRKFCVQTDEDGDIW